MMARPKQAPLPRVIVVGDGPATTSLSSLLAARGLEVESQGTADGAGPLCAAIASVDDPDAVVALASGCREAAEAGRPRIVLVPAGAPDDGRREHAAAYLLAEGACVVDDPDVWLECVVLCAHFGLPAGNTIALVAGDDSWMALAAAALAARDAGNSRRVLENSDDTGPTDIVLCDANAAADRTHTKSGARIIPVHPRALTPAGRPALCGLGAAIAAANATAAVSARRAIGFGPAEPDHSELDRERFDGRLDRLTAIAGDHESKVLLSASGVTVSRQAVASTPSAAVRLAKRAGFPVDLKPWNPTAPLEGAGGHVEYQLSSAAEVRRAYELLADDTADTGGAVIVRESPPAGRELALTVERAGPYGWMISIAPEGGPTLAARCPLREYDAARLASAVVSSRAGDAPVDREALIEQLVRLSNVPGHSPRIEAIDVGRLVVPKSGGAVVVDVRVSLS